MYVHACTTCPYIDLTVTQTCIRHVLCLGHSFYLCHRPLTKKASILGYLPRNQGTWFPFVRRMIYQRLSLILVLQVSLRLFLTPSYDWWISPLPLLCTHVMCRTPSKSSYILSLNISRLLHTPIVRFLY